MVSVGAWATLALAATVWGTGANLASALLWTVDKVDRMFNPLTRARIARQREVRENLLRTRHIDTSGR